VAVVVVASVLIENWIPLIRAPPFRISYIKPL